jgi:hypothetical protein
VNGLHLELCGGQRPDALRRSGALARLPNDPVGSKSQGEPPAVSIAAKHAHVGGFSEAGSLDRLADFRIVTCVVLDRTARQQVGGSSHRGVGVPGFGPAELVR